MPTLLWSHGRGRIRICLEFQISCSLQSVSFWWSYERDWMNRRTWWLVHINGTLANDNDQKSWSGLEMSTCHNAIQVRLPKNSITSILCNQSLGWVGTRSSSYRQRYFGNQSIIPMLRHVLDLLYSHRTHGHIRTIENAELRDRLTAEYIRGLDMRGLIDNYFLAKY